MLYGSDFPKTPEEREERKLAENLHKKTNDRINFLVKHFFRHYDLNPYGFHTEFYKWLSQFEVDSDNADNIDGFDAEMRYVFLLVSKLLFFNRVQIISLINVVWEKVKKELFCNLRDSNGITSFDILGVTDLIEKEFENSLFTPLSDSSKFEEFRHVMPDGVHKKITIESIGYLTNPIDDNIPQYIDFINKKYEAKTNLFIVEDFSGSGTTILKKIDQIADNYNFKRIYFCPLIITENANNNIEEAIEQNEKLKQIVKVIHGLQVDEYFSVASESLEYWSKKESEVLREMSKKYYNLYFNYNGYLYDDYLKTHPLNPTPYGFKNGGYPIILYTNCPNNSLPVIWSNNNNWCPLFIRNERYARVLEDDERKFV